MKLFIKTSLISLILMSFLISTAGAAKLDLSGLLVLYLCDDGSGDTLKDSSGNGWDADAPGAEWEKGVFGNAVRLSGTNTEVAGDIISSTAETGEISMMCWLNMASHSNYNGIISIQSPVGDVCDYRLMVNPAKNPFWNAGHHVDQSLANFTFDTDTWYHYALTADGEINIVYIDGEPIGEVVDNFDLPEFDDVSLYIGTGEAPGTWQIEDCAIDEVMVWDRVLDEDEMQIMLEGYKVFAAVDANGKVASTWGVLKAD